MPRPYACEVAWLLPRVGMGMLQDASGSGPVHAAMQRPGRVWSRSALQNSRQQSAWELFPGVTFECAVDSRAMTPPRDAVVDSRQQ